MSILWLLVILLTGLTISASSISPGPADPVTDANQDQSSPLRFVFAFFRHGTRTPMYPPYPNDPNKSLYAQYFPIHGQLTETGMKMMYEAGKKLKERYGDFIGGYSGDKVYVTSTETPRTITTAQIVMAGLFPASDPLFKDLGKWQPIPVWQGAREFDKSYLLNNRYNATQLNEGCPKYGVMIGKSLTAIAQSDMAPEHQNLYNILQQYSGIKEMNSILANHELFDTLQYENLNGLPLPPWTTEQRECFENKPLYPDLMAPLMRKWFEDLLFLNEDKEMLELFTGPLFHSIQEHFQESFKNASSPSKFRFHSTHDFVIYAFLFAFGLSEPVTVGPGEGVLFELHEENQNPLIKVFYFETFNNYSVREVNLPLCPYPCSLTKFSEIAIAFSPEQWNRNCKK